ncbi:hypothetical protein ANANG_G00320250 [Anguilla anguilla]|uniref:Immunoglobulin C1-set domain-containing protein n=1 Tax=Anguilla anguilla TaxID=7936 RepID=A0A9D3LKS8_ANGAN|nr:hypothetical protein ANANG_G00320250 [Anguilla anguilla]
MQGDWSGEGELSGHWLLPRHINLTMLRDDRPIPDEELIFGEVLPNGDGTYQTRRTLSISSEIAREKHRYTCSVTHLALDNKLDINWGI